MPDICVNQNSQDIFRGYFLQGKVFALNSSSSI